MICGFCITSDYGIVSPVSNSIFLTQPWHRFFPLCVAGHSSFKFSQWLSSITGIYQDSALNGCSSRSFSFRRYVNTFCAISMTKIPFVRFLFLCLEEIYIMLLFQQLWSVIHSTIQMGQAKFLYGLIFAMRRLRRYLRQHSARLSLRLVNGISKSNLCFACRSL